MSECVLKTLACRSLRVGSSKNLPKHGPPNEVLGIFLLGVVPRSLKHLVAQCSATPATVAATPPCSATTFQNLNFGATPPGTGGGEGATPKFLGV